MERAQSLRLELVIVVQPGDEFSRRLSYGSIPCRRRSARAVIAQDANPGVCARDRFQKRCSPIIRCVVNDDELKIGEPLREYRAYSRRQ